MDRNNLNSRNDSAADAWDDLAVNPHAAALAEGRRLGVVDGRAAGFGQGYATGLVSATDLGLELGFVRGVVEVLQQQLQLSLIHEDERVQKSIDCLQKALDDFPSPAAVFPPNHGTGGGEEDPRMRTSEEDSNHNDNTTDEFSTSSSSLKAEEGAGEDDVAGKMQRIRARFKLLMVQLGLPHFSLKRVMDQAATGTTVNTVQQHSASNNEQPAPQPTTHPEHVQETSEW